MEKIKVRSFTPEIKKLDEENRIITFVASDGSRDSAHTVLNQDGWKLDRFNKNPVIGYNHDIYGGWSGNDIDKVIGKGRAYVEDGKLMVDITFEPKEINQLAEKVYQKILFGSLNAVSVGFLPVGKGAWGKGDEAVGEANETYYYAGQELLEISVVNIPANSNATRKGEDPEQVELEELRKEAEPEKPEDPKLSPEEEEAKRKAEEEAAKRALQDEFELTMAAAEAAL